MLAHTPPPRTLRLTAVRGCFGARLHRLHPPTSAPRTLRSPASKVLWRAPARSRRRPGRPFPPPHSAPRWRPQRCSGVQLQGAAAEPGAGGCALLRGVGWATAPAVSVVSPRAARRGPASYWTSAPWCACVGRTLRPFSWVC